MSSSATAPAPSPAVGARKPSAPPAGTTGAGVAGVAKGDIPTTLASLRLFTAALLVLASVGLAGLLAHTWNSTAQARSDTAQLLRVQGIKVDLLRTDALATNAFLIGGLEPATQRAAYDKALSEVSAAVADAADAQPRDREALGRLNDSVVNYAELMELARANNRQGFPVGAAYLTRADTELRQTAIPLVDALVTANRERSESSINSTHALLLGLIAVVVVGALWLANQWLARTFRRRINVGVAVAAALLVAVATGGVLVSAAQADANTDLLAGSYQRAVAGAEARSAANDAKAAESLRLINRGSGGVVEEQWRAANQTVVSNLNENRDAWDLDRLWTAYSDGHARVVAADERGDWDTARNLAIGDGAKDPSTTFAAFDTEVENAVDAAARVTTTSLGSRLTIFFSLAIFSVLAGLVAAAAAWRGISTRLKEYE